MNNISKIHPEPARQSEQSDCSTGKCACDPEQINANHVSQLRGPLALTYELQKDYFWGPVLLAKCHVSTSHRK